MGNIDNDKKKNISQTIGKKIYELRTQKKYSREFLAEKTNLSANYIYEIENGNYMLGCIPIIDICNALEITPTELLSDFLTQQKKIQEETIAKELDKLCEADCNMILTLIKMMSER